MHLIREHYFLIGLALIIICFLAYVVYKGFKYAHTMPENLRFEFYSGKKNCFNAIDAENFYKQERDIRKIRKLHMNIYDAETGKFLKRVTCSEYFM